MNIFVLDSDPIKAAQAQCDKHVVKMCLETAQILSTVAHGPYKPTHQSHPCTLWAGSHRGNYDWLVMHGLALCEEYTARYQKRHKCQDIISGLANRGNLFPPGKSPHVQCMPDQYRAADPVTAYRQYYHSKTFAEWKRSSTPEWWQK